MRVASDIGGTFTDLAYLDEATGETGVLKTSTTPADFARAVLLTLEKAGFEIPATRFFIHGSTVVINALTERKGAKTGLITTRGFRDVLEITRANRPDLYNMYYTKPKPFVPRQFRLEVRERMNHRGEELLRLNEEDVEKAVAYFRKEGIESIAVCFLHSYANPAHERRCGEIIRRTAPEIPVTLSCEITQEWREYERTSTAVLNSYVLRKTGAYLDNLEKKLSQMGMEKVCHIMQSNGGTVTFEYGKAAPINSVVRSGRGGNRGSGSGESDRRARSCNLRCWRHHRKGIPGRRRKPPDLLRLLDRAEQEFCRLSDSYPDHRHCRDRFRGWITGLGGRGGSTAGRT
jgi:N-methylhydantoinase A